MAALTTNKSILSWIDEKAALVKPDEIVGLPVAQRNVKSLARQRAREVRCVN